MSALNRVRCPHCSRDVMILRSAANRRWLCGHCEGIVDLDVLEGIAGDGAGAPAPIESEDLPTAQACPPPAADLGAAPAPAPLVGISAFGGPRAERERVADQAMRRNALIEAAKRSRLVTAMTAVFCILGFVIVAYPARVDENALLPPLQYYFQGRPVIFPYFFASPRWYLVVFLLIAANGIYYGKTWAPTLAAALLVLTCVAYDLHPAVILISAALLPPLWLLRRKIRFTRP